MSSSKGDDPVRPAGPVAGPLLIAEDNRTNQALAVAMLAKLGFVAEVVADGAQAVEAVRRTRYAAVLMDCEMPVLDGYAATAAIRKAEREGARTPIIAMTAAAMVGARERCLAAGMDDYVAKPIMLDALEDVLHRWLDARAGARASPLGADAVVPEGPFDPQRVAALRALNRPDRPDVFVQLAETFVVQAKAQVARLERALAEGDEEEVGRQAHGLRGGSATVGAVRLADLCAALENALRVGPAPGPSGVLPIAAELEHVQAALRGNAGEPP